MASTLPSYIQKRVDNNKLRIKEIKNILIEKDDDESLDLSEELAFLIKENKSLMSINYEIPTYTELQVERIVADSDIKPEEFNPEEHFQENIILKDEQEISGSMLEAKTLEHYGEYLYQIQPKNDLSYLEKSDEELFKEYGIKFVNGLPTDIDLDRTPSFVIDRIKAMNTMDRLKLSKNKTFNTSDQYGIDSLETIYYESQITKEVIDEALDVDFSAESPYTMKYYKGKTDLKNYVLVQLKPDYQVSNDYRYVFVDKFEKFEEYYKLLEDKTKEFSFPTYKHIKKINT